MDVLEEAIRLRKGENVFFKETTQKHGNIKEDGGGTWVVQSVKPLPLGFGSDPDLRVVEWSPTSAPRTVLSGESARDSLSPSCPFGSCSLSLKEINL